MNRLTLNLAALPVLALATPLAAQDGPAPAPAPAGQSEIVVTAEMEREAEQRVERMTRAISRRPRVDKPIAKQYDPICIGVFGMSPDYSYTLIDTIEANARRLGIPIAGEGRKANLLVAFVSDARTEVEQLRKDAPWLFSTLLDYEYDRVLRGNGAAHAWQTTETREVDGEQLDVAEINGRQVQVARPFSATRFEQQIRTDMVGSAVIIDKAAVPGKTLQQLADYVSMRSFAPVDDLSDGGVDATGTILSLFDADITPPDSMTGFDWAYLDALYKLPATAKGQAIHDATWSEYRRSVFKLED